MASIYKRKNRNGNGFKWRAVIRIKGFPSVSKTFNRKQEAEDWSQEIERQIKKGQFRFDLHNTQYTFTDLVTRFINDGKLDLHRSSKDTSRHLKYWKERIGAYSLIHITSDLVSKERTIIKESFIKKGSQTVLRSPATVNRYMSSLSTVLTYAKKMQWIVENPCSIISKLKESKGRDRTLSIKELTTLLEACKKSSNKYLYCIVLIAVTSGARKGEILALKWADIDFDNKVAYIRQTKNNHPRTIPLVDLIISEMQNIYNKRDHLKELVFSSKTVFGKIEITKAWQRALKQAEIENFVFHSLRHQFSTEAATLGASALELQT